MFKICGEKSLDENIHKHYQHLPVLDACFCFYIFLCLKILQPNPLTLLVGMQTSTTTMENSVDFLKKLQIELPYDPAIPLLGIHTEETRIERDTCTPMFIAALFIIARAWKQPRCPSADEWIRKL